MRNILYLSVLFLIFLSSIFVVNVVLATQKYNEALSKFLEQQIVANLGTLDLIIHEGVYTGLPLYQINDIEGVIFKLITNNPLIISVDVANTSGNILFTSDKDASYHSLSRDEINQIIYGRSSVFTRENKEEKKFSLYKRLDHQGKTYGFYRVVYKNYYAPVLQEFWLDLWKNFIVPIAVLLLFSILGFSYFVWRSILLLRYWSDVMVGAKDLSDSGKIKRLEAFVGSDFVKNVIDIKNEDTKH